ncbi:hypothetical protein A6F58_19540 [Prescottella equi]|nr:hypothetical protein A6F58_19540 [Prescottella equi]
MLDLRCTVAWLMLAEHGICAENTDRVLLIAEDKVRLTARMHHLELSLVREPRSRCGRSRRHRTMGHRR